MTAPPSSPIVLIAVGVWLAALVAVARQREFAIGLRDAAIWPLALSAVAFTWVALVTRPGPAGVTCAVVASAIAVGALTDLRTGYIFDAVTLPAAVLATVLACANGAELCAVGGLALLGLIFGATFLFSRGRLIGGGDVKAMLAIGAAFGPVQSILVLLIASVCGVAASLCMGDRRTVRFGPHLATGVLGALIGGDQFVHRGLGL